jgi:transcriptional regulator with XRE-family HTH domain
MMEDAKIMGVRMYREQTTMARFKTRLKQLMLEKSVELGYPLTQKQVAEKTELSLPTISRWYKSEIDRIEPDTAARLTKFFGITFPELVELVDDAETEG